MNSHRGMKLAGTRAASCALAGLVFLLAPRSAAAQLSTDAAELEFRPARGDSVLSFQIANTASEPIEAAVYLGDWERHADGENVFHDSGTLPASCHGRLEVFPSALRLEPGGSQAVRVALKDGAPPETACWSIVFVESRPAPLAGGTGISYSLRLGIKAYVLPAGLASEGEVEDAAVRPGPDGGREVAFRFRNTGGLPLRVRGAVELRRFDNGLAAAIEVPELPVLPGAARELSLAVPPLAPGPYVALVLLDYGAAEIAAAQVDIEVE